MFYAEQNKQRKKSYDMTKQGRKTKLLHKNVIYSLCFTQNKTNREKKNHMIYEKLNRAKKTKILL